MRRLTPGTLALVAIYMVVFTGFELWEPTRQRLVAAGAIDPVRIVAGEPWRLITAAFAHIGVVHLAFNTMFLIQVGPVLESWIGLGRYLALYVIAGIGGNLAIAILYQPAQMAAGGSTALFGIDGALLAILVRREHSYRDVLENPAARALGVNILVNLVLGWMIPFISNTGHIGGLVTGFGVAFFWFALSEAGSRVARKPLAQRLASLLVFGAAVLLALVPFPRSWYQAREIWLGPPARVAAMREILAARGLGPDADRLILMRTLREPSLAGTLPKPDLSPGSSFHPYLLGIDYRQFAAFHEALEQSEPDAARHLPQDPWLWR